MLLQPTLTDPPADHDYLSGNGVPEVAGLPSTA
jgi:hypothetical protein